MQGRRRAIRLQQAVRGKRVAQQIQRRRLKYGPWLKAVRDFIVLLFALYCLVALSSYLLEVFK